MQWEQLLSVKRFGLEQYHDPQKRNRTEFKRDHDRLIFSPSFRRLQNKTQVYPLPGKIFVHNRLTHSLEVSSVGSSLAESISEQLIMRHGTACGPYMGDIGTIVSTGCLAHDMGNPPFGHSGEKAIATYFSEGEGLPYRDEPGLSQDQWDDIVNFEGNANALRLLTHQFRDHRPGGFVCTYSTLASIVKYPYASSYIEKAGKSKFGFFQSEKDSFLRIAQELGMPEVEEGRFARHPLVYLVEAADDICYEIMDIEDANKLHLISTESTIDLMLAFFPPDVKDRRRKTASGIADQNERIAYLRSCVIGTLVDECASVFLDNEEDILSGRFTGSLVSHMSPLVLEAYRDCDKTSWDHIYRSQYVVDIEIAGYNIIYTLIDRLCKAVFNPEKAYSKQLLFRVPRQYETDAPDVYGKLLAVLDYISSMTDNYALDLYQKITGMSLPVL